jgi:RNA polymerase sigma factor (sigma-70 family)
LTTDRFRELSEAQLQNLSDEELITYIRSGRAAGRSDAVTLALRIMVFGHYANVERRVRIKVPTEAVEEVTGDAFVRALKAAFDGDSVGQFVSWLGQITRAAIADYYRRGAPKHPGGVARPDRLPEGPPGSEDVGGRKRGREVEPATSGEYDAVESQLVVDHVLNGLSTAHRRAVELYLFDGWAGVDAGRKIGEELGEELSEANVHQIASRFRRELRAALGTPGP